MAMGISAAGSTTGSDDGEATAGAVDTVGDSPAGRFLRAIGMLAVGSSSGGGDDGGRGRGTAGDARTTGRFFREIGTATVASTSASAAPGATAVTNGSTPSKGGDARPGEHARPSPPPGRPRGGGSDAPQGANGGADAGGGSGRFLRPPAKAARDLASTGSRGGVRSAPPLRGGGGRFFPNGAAAAAPHLSASLPAPARGDDRAARAAGGCFFLGISNGSSDAAATAGAVPAAAAPSPPDPGPSIRGGDG